MCESGTSPNSANLDPSSSALRILALTAEQDKAKTTELVEDFRREVQDKLGVVFHDAKNPLMVQRQIALKQCEDFLVEQFESALECAEAQLTVLRQERDALKEAHAELDTRINLLPRRRLDSEANTEWVNLAAVLLLLRYPRRELGTTGTAPSSRTASPNGKASSDV